MRFLKFSGFCTDDDVVDLGYLWKYLSRNIKIIILVWKVLKEGKMVADLFTFTMLGSFIIIRSKFIRILAEEHSVARAFVLL